MNQLLETKSTTEKNDVLFRVWAPPVQKLEVVFFENGKVVFNQELEREEKGYFSGLVSNVKPETRYMFRLDGDKLRPDPTSRYQPEGVHGPSAVINPYNFNWTDNGWKGILPEEAVIYELHIGTATPAGTFQALIEKLDYFKELGVTVLELLPVADFPGERNWGYDGVAQFAPARCYGHPNDFKALVAAAHAKGLAVLLDVVYNHFGPDGNYLRDFSPDYFTEEYQTPWGAAINFANPEVRKFFFNNALYWLQEFHLDGLRLDATHAIEDRSQPHFLTELVEFLRLWQTVDNQWLLYAEDERNDSRLIQPINSGGYGLDGVWADDFHHEMRVATAGDRDGYFQDFSGNIADIVATLKQGWFYRGQYSGYSGNARGTDTQNLSPSKFVHCIQNHDQIGNRPFGDRLNFNIHPETYRALSALLLLSPYTPLLFQGQEWSATTPWQYFTDHNPELGKLVTEGRRSEFSRFVAFANKEIPDPQAVTTFEGSKLNWQELSQPSHSSILTLYRDFLMWRRNLLPFITAGRKGFEVNSVGETALYLRYLNPTTNKDNLILFNLNEKATFQLSEICKANGNWQLVLHSEMQGYLGKDEIKYDNITGGLEVKGSVTLLFQEIN